MASPKLYRHRISLTIASEDKKLRLYEANQIQSPGPISYLAEVSDKEMDPFVEAISLEKSSALSDAEARELLPADATDPVGKPNKSGKHNKANSSKKVRVKSGLVHKGDLRRALLIAELEKQGINVADGLVKKSEIIKALAAVSRAKK